MRRRVHHTLDRPSMREPAHLGKKQQEQRTDQPRSRKNNTKECLLTHVAQRADCKPPFFFSRLSPFRRGCYSTQRHTRLNRHSQSPISGDAKAARMNGAADGQSDSRRVSPVESGKIVEKDRWDLGRKGVCLWLHGRSCKNIPRRICFASSCLASASF